MPYQSLKHFYFQHNKQEPPPLSPPRPGHGGEKGFFPFPPAPRTPEQPRRFRASPNDTKSSFTEPGRANMQRSSPAPTRRKKKIPPSFIPSKTPPSHGTGKGDAPLLKRRIKAGKRRPCPEGTWRSGASAGRRRPHPPSRAPERPSSRWKPSFLPRPSEPLHGPP